MRRFLAGAVLALAVVSLPHPGQAQASGAAFASLTATIELDPPNPPFHGPWQATDTHLNIRFWVVCIDLVNPETKHVGQAVAHVPNDSIAQIRSIATAAVQAMCSAGNITVSAGAVLLPAFNTGI